MTSSARQVPPREIVTAAADWFARLQEEDVSEQDLQQWQGWLRASPEHQRAYREIKNAWDLIEKVDPAPWPSAQELATDGRTDAEASGLATTERSRQGRAASHRLMHWSLAATVLLAVVLGGALQFSDSWSARRYSTATAEQRSIKLSDGSRVTIGAASSVTPMFEDETRRVTLDYGEAFFEVAHDPQRPFIVVVGGIEVRAVGTAFNVRANDDRVLVSVTEGRVAVTSEVPPAAGFRASLGKKNQNAVRYAERATIPVVLVSAGHQAILTAEGNVEQRERPTSEIATWRTGRFEYRGEELRHVIEDLNRYADPPIVLSDDAATLRYSGTVFPDQIDEWLEGVSGALPVTVHDNGIKRSIARVK